MKSKVYDIKGKEKGSVDLPKCFSANVREDIVAKVVEAKKIQQAYGASPMAGNQYAASGKLNHRRGVWKSQYKRGISRIPRKIMSRKGSQFRWVGATVPNARGGRRAHPPKANKLYDAKINKKELLIAICSALSATTQSKFIEKKYNRIDAKMIKDVPFVIESKVNGVKIKDVLAGIKAMLGKDLFEVAIKKRSIRAGIGKLRGRKYKSNAGMLLVVGKDEKVKTGAFDVQTVDKLGVVDLANGGLGRLTVYTENAIKELGEKIKC